MKAAIAASIRRIILRFFILATKLSFAVSFPSGKVVEPLLLFGVVIFFFETMRNEIKIGVSSRETLTNCGLPLSPRPIVPNRYCASFSCFRETSASKVLSSFSTPTKLDK